MSVVTTRPTSTISSTAATVTGAASAHAALADDSDASYVALAPASALKLGFASPTAPGGATVKSMRLRLRTAKGTVYLGGLNPSGFCTFGYGYVPALSVTQTSAFWTTPVTFKQVEVVIGITPTTIVLEFAFLQTTDYASLIVYEAYCDTVYVVAPVAVPTAPTGVITANTPTVVFNATLDTDGGQETGYEVRIFTSAVYGGGGFNASTSTAVSESGVVTVPVGTPTGSGTFVSTVALADGAYRAYVRVAQTFGTLAVNPPGSISTVPQPTWSAWAYIAFTVTTPRPAVPTLVAAAQNGSGRILLTVTDPGGGGLTTDYFEIQRSTNAFDDSLWKPVRTLLPSGISATGGVATPVLIYDYEAGNGQPIAYRARAVHAATGAIYTYSTWATATATWSSGSWWLKHPYNPALNIAVTPRSQPGRARAARQGLFQPLGRDDAVAISDTYGPWTGDLVLRVTSDADRAALDALIDEHDPLLVQAPAGTPDWPDTWIAVGDQMRDRVVDTAGFAYTFDTLPWTEVARPDGVSLV